MEMVNYPDGQSIRVRLIDDCGYDEEAADKRVGVVLGLEGDLRSAFLQWWDSGSFDESRIAPVGGYPYEYIKNRHGYVMGSRGVREERNGLVMLLYLEYLRRQGDAAARRIIDEPIYVREPSK